MFLVIGGSYELVTEGFVGLELPARAEGSPGLRRRHGVGVVEDPAGQNGRDRHDPPGNDAENGDLRDDFPPVEGDAEIAEGAVIIGSAIVGAGARIGPNAIVFRDVPVGATVASPASEIRS